MGTHFMVGNSGRAVGCDTVARYGLPDARRNLGELRIQFQDHEDGVRFTARERMVAGARVGRDEGYADLDSALRGLAALTVEEPPAAAVLERDGRYYGHVPKARNVEPGFVSPLRPLHLEPDHPVSVVNLRATSRFDRLVALVDGAWSHRFRS